jgi:acylphosphatase
VSGGSPREVEVVRRHVWVSGRVQGVWFRQGAQQEAERLGVRGWVSNRPDGRVEGAFEGPRDAVDTLVAWCRKGPLRARVQSVEVRDELVLGETGFRIA